MFLAEILKISKFLSGNFQFLEVKFSIYLYRRVFVMVLHLIRNWCVYSITFVSERTYVRLFVHIKIVNIRWNCTTMAI